MLKQRSNVTEIDFIVTLYTYCLYWKGWLNGLCDDKVSRPTRWNHFEYLLKSIQKSYFDYVEKKGFLFQIVLYAALQQSWSF